MGIFREDKIEPMDLGGYISVIEDYDEGHSEVNIDEWAEGTKPEVSFAKCFYLNDHDSRLQLSSDTYVQLIHGLGITVNGDDKNAVEKIQDWFREIGFEEKLEDGTYSYVITGNVMFEKSPMMADITEVDITTIKSVKRLKNGKIKYYNQFVNNEEKKLQAKDYALLKFTNRRREVWGRSLFQSIISPKMIKGKQIESAVEEMWRIEHAMVKIFQAYASPMMIIWFKDVGEQFIKDKEQEFKKLGPGAKILTDKEFEVKIFEVNPASKFDKYIEHYEKDVIETGTQFANQIITAGFTARASSESATDVIKLKVRRIQKRYGLQITQQFANPYLDALKKGWSKKAKIVIDFKFDTESVLTIQDSVNLFEKGILTRSEIRDYINKNTDVPINTDDMDDTPPITSVTPTNDLRTSQPSPAAQGMVQIPRESLEKLIEVIAEKLPNPRGRFKDSEANEEAIQAKKLEILEKLLSTDKDDELI